MLVNGAMSVVRYPLAWGEHTLGKTKEEEAVKHSYWTVGIPTVGEVKPEDEWYVASSSGALTRIPEKAKVEIQPTYPNPIYFTIHVVTNRLTVKKTVKEKITKHGRTVTKKVPKKVTEPPVKGEFTQANFPLSSQLVLEH